MKQCGTCKYNTPEYEGGTREVKDFYCDNEESECYGLPTAYDDSCEDWEEKEDQGIMVLMRFDSAYAFCGGSNFPTPQTECCQHNTPFDLVYPSWCVTEVQFLCRGIGNFAIV